MPQEKEKWKYGIPPPRLASSEKPGSFAARSYIKEEVLYLQHLQDDILAYVIQKYKPVNNNPDALDKTGWKEYQELISQSWQMADWERDKRQYGKRALRPPIRESEFMWKSKEEYAAVREAIQKRLTDTSLTQLRVDSSEDSVSSSISGPPPSSQDEHVFQEIKDPNPYEYAKRIGLDRKLIPSRNEIREFMKKVDPGLQVKFLDSKPIRSLTKGELRIFQQVRQERLNAWLDDRKSTPKDDNRGGVKTMTRSEYYKRVELPAGYRAGELGSTDAVQRRAILETERAKKKEVKKRIRRELPALHTETPFIADKKTPIRASSSSRKTVIPATPEVAAALFPSEEGDKDDSIILFPESEDEEEDDEAEKKRRDEEDFPLQISPGTPPEAAAAAFQPTETFQWGGMTARERRLQSRSERLEPWRQEWFKTTDDKAKDKKKKKGRAGGGGKATPVKMISSSSSVVPYQRPNARHQFKPIDVGGEEEDESYFSQAIRDWTKEDVVFGQTPERTRKQTEDIRDLTRKFVGSPQPIGQTPESLRKKEEGVQFIRDLTRKFMGSPQPKPQPKPPAVVADVAARQPNPVINPDAEEAGGEPVSQPDLMISVYIVEKLTPILRVIEDPLSDTNQRDIAVQQYNLFMSDFWGKKDHGTARGESIVRVPLDKYLTEAIQNAHTMALQQLMAYSQMSQMEARDKSVGQNTIIKFPYPTFIHRVPETGMYESLSYLIIPKEWTSMNQFRDKFRTDIAANKNLEYWYHTIFGPSQESSSAASETLSESLKRHYTQDEIIEGLAPLEPLVAGLPSMEAILATHTDPSAFASIMMDVASRIPGIHIPNPEDPTLFSQIVRSLREVNGIPPPPEPEPIQQRLQPPVVHLPPPPPEKEDEKAFEMPAAVYQNLVNVISGLMSPIVSAETKHMYAESYNKYMSDYLTINDDDDGDDPHVHLDYAVRDSVRHAYYDALERLRQKQIITKTTHDRMKTNHPFLQTLPASIDFQEGLPGDYIYNKKIEMKDRTLDDIRKKLRTYTNYQKPKDKDPIRTPPRPIISEVDVATKSPVLPLLSPGSGALVRRPLPQLVVPLPPFKKTPIKKAKERKKVRIIPEPVETPEVIFLSGPPGDPVPDAVVNPVVVPPPLPQYSPEVFSDDPEMYKPKVYSTSSSSSSVRAKPYIPKTQYTTFAVRLNNLRFLSTAQKRAAIKRYENQIAIENQAKKIQKKGPIKIDRQIQIGDAIIGELKEQYAARTNPIVVDVPEEIKLTAAVHRPLAEGRLVGDGGRIIVRDPGAIVVPMDIVRDPAPLPPPPPPIPQPIPPPIPPPERVIYDSDDDIDLIPDDRRVERLQRLPALRFGRPVFPRAELANDMRSQLQLHRPNPGRARMDQGRAIRSNLIRSGNYQPCNEFRRDHGVYNRPKDQARFLPYGVRYNKWK